MADHLRCASSQSAASMEEADRGPHARPVVSGDECSPAPRARSGRRQRDYRTPSRSRLPLPSRCCLVEASPSGAAVPRPISGSEGIRPSVASYIRLLARVRAAPHCPNPSEIAVTRAGVHARLAHEALGRAHRLSACTISVTGSCMGHARVHASRTTVHAAGVGGRAGAAARAPTPRAARPTIPHTPNGHRYRQKPRRPSAAGARVSPTSPKYVTRLPASGDRHPGLRHVQRLERRASHPCRHRRAPSTAPNPRRPQRRTSPPAGSRTRFSGPSTVTDSQSCCSPLNGQTQPQNERPSTNDVAKIAQPQQRARTSRRARPCPASSGTGSSSSA